MMLIYAGGGVLVGVPARNLTDEEVKEYGRERLIESGLYKEPEKPKPAENKMAAGPQENKSEV
jgi:hypothetical protein